MSGSFSTSTEPETWSYSLRRYLHTAWLPAWIAWPIDDVQGERMLPSGKGRQWPFYRLLIRPVGHRNLKRVTCMPFEELQALSLEYSRGLNDITIKATAFADSGYLKLPNPDFIDLDDADHARLSEEISLKGELAKLVLDYVMCTISESMRLTYGTPRSFPRAKRLLFRHYDRAQFADAKWDILTLPATSPHTNALIVITVPPWSFGSKDLDDFAAPRDIIPGSLDTLQSRDNADTLWAVLLDACVQTNCHYFVITTYDSWVFGNFSPSYLISRVTPWFHAPVPVELTDGPSEFLVDPEEPGTPETSFMERLLYWTQAGRGAAKGCASDETSLSNSTLLGAFTSAISFGLLGARF